jgi:hypothetical protein
MTKQWVRFLAVMVIGFGGLVILLLYAEQHTQQRTAEQACPYEEYFEYQGGGVYHLELDDFFMDGRKDLDTSRVTAKIIACWCQAHKKEFRIVGVSMLLKNRYPPYIIITEPVK